MRHERRSRTMPGLSAAMEEMMTVVEHNRGGDAAPHSEERTLKECVTVMIWEEADGSETIEVVGEHEPTPLQMKGVLHDAIYAIAQDYDRTAKA